MAKEKFLRVMEVADNACLTRGHNKEIQFVAQTYVLEIKCLHILELVWIVRIGKNHQAMVENVLGKNSDVMRDNKSMELALLVSHVLVIQEPKITTNSVTQTNVFFQRNSSIFKVNVNPVHLDSSHRNQG